MTPSTIGTSSSFWAYGINVAAKVKGKVERTGDRKGRKKKKKKSSQGIKVFAYHSSGSSSCWAETSASRFASLSSLEDIIPDQSLVAAGKIEASEGHLRASWWDQK